jgi:S1-C subfamily serine protease
MIRNVKDLPTELKEKVKVLEGAYVSDFASVSSAKSAGIEQGDVITAVNDSKVRSASELQEKIIQYRPGDKVKVTVDREGATKTFTIELRNAQGNTEVVKGAGDAGELLGAAFKALSPKQKQELGISYGIEVAAVFNGKIKEAGIVKGFIIMIANDQKISSPEELEKVVERVLKNNTDEKLLVLKGINTNGRNRYYAIDLAN